MSDSIRLERPHDHAIGVNDGDVTDAAEVASILELKGYLSATSNAFRDLCLLAFVKTS